MELYRRNKQNSLLHIKQQQQKEHYLIMIYLFICNSLLCISDSSLLFLNICRSFLIFLFVLYYRYRNYIKQEKIYRFVYFFFNFSLIYFIIKYTHIVSGYMRLQFIIIIIIIIFFQFSFTYGFYIMYYCCDTIQEEGKILKLTRKHLQLKKKRKKEKKKL